MSSIEAIDLEVEVTVKQGDSSTERGALLENLAMRVLGALQHEHVSTNVRVTGCELDLIAKEKQTGAKVVVECKAYRDQAVSADTLTKLVGNTIFHDYQSAWLITTSKLSKDAKGLWDLQRAKPVIERQRLRVYGPKELVELLVTTGQVVDPASLALPKVETLTATRTLLITDVGTFWAVTVLGPSSGVADTVLAYHAKTGAQVTNSALLQGLASRDSNLRNLQWIGSDEELSAVGALADASLKQELDSIAPVPIADDWSDYRPARPQDFVGRDDLLKDIVRFFDDVRQRSTSTRLLAVKAPSGWGKSSFLVKLRSLCEQGRNKERIYLYAVDCRTATSARYPELALKRCLDEAIEAGFIGDPAIAPRISSAGQPFADGSVQALLRELEQQNKVVVLFFDQFEEITTKQELADLFVQIKMLCAAVESAGESVVLGFSWKTDGSIPTDHPAYHIWHSFADRRREFELPLFSKTDTAQLLGRLSKELQAPIERSVSRLLADHCQGYPWLLKKLCVHVFRVLQTQPAKQRELLERALDVESLFKKDLSDLDHTQHACLMQIAKESPADHFKISERYSDPVIGALIQRRLVVRNSGKLIVYWDIFRDYLLTGLVPVIPARYLPVSSAKTAKLVMEALPGSSNLEVLGRKLKLQRGTLDNAARDLVMVGVCEYDRKKARLKLLDTAPARTLAAAFRFFSTHALMRMLIDKYGKGFRDLPVIAIRATWAAEFASSNYAEKTIDLTTRRMIGWFNALGIVTVDGDATVTHRQDELAPVEFSLFRAEGRSRSAAKLFVGEAGPQKVLEVLRELQRQDFVPKPQDRNALYVLSGLGIVQSATRPVLLQIPPKGREEFWLASKVINQPTIRAARILSPSGNGPLDIGEEIAKVTGKTLSDASKRRYGSGVLVWLNWLRTGPSARTYPAPTDVTART